MLGVVSVLLFFQTNKECIFLQYVDLISPFEAVRTVI